MFGKPRHQLSVLNATSESSASSSKFAGPSAPNGNIECVPQHATIHALQVQAFLNASEDVQIDQETMDDILDGFDDGSETDKSEKGFANGHEDEEGGDGSDTEGSADGGENELDISALYLTEPEAQSQSTWSKEDIKNMMDHLKQRGMASFIREYVVYQSIPIPRLLTAFGIHLCKELRGKNFKSLLYFLRVALSRELSIRDRLTRYSSVSDAVDLILQSSRIMILTGAGISVSCGIPDFRSRDGLYASLKEKGNYQLDDPQQMFDINYFRENPSVFYSLASQIYPSNFIPSPCHRFIKLVEDRGKLLRNYTQNIDTLEHAAGVSRVLQCHGSFATATCLQCRRSVAGAVIEADILKQKVPLCTVCNLVAPSTSKKKGKHKARKKEWDSDEEDEREYPLGIMKPDITFFGEKLTQEFDRLLLEDRQKVDLLLIIGTSLKVSPVAEMLSFLPHSVPQVLINKTPIKHINSDIVLLGDADEIVQYLCQRLNWELPPPAPPPSTSMRIQLPRGNVKKRKSSNLIQEPRQVGNSHVWLFDGAEGGKWVQDIKESFEQSMNVMTTRELKKARTK